MLRDSDILDLIMYSNHSENVCKYYDIFCAEMEEGLTVLLSNFADKNSGLSDFTKTGFRAMKLNKQENKRPIHSGHGT